jgi:hypothetical protein
MHVRRAKKRLRGGDGVADLPVIGSASGIGIPPISRALSALDLDVPPV